MKQDKEYQPEAMRDRGVFGGVETSLSMPTIEVRLNENIHTIVIYTSQATGWAFARCAKRDSGFKTLSSSDSVFLNLK